jgi:uncharacterized membrane protein
VSAELLALIAAVLRGVGQTLQKHGAATAIGGISLREVSRGFGSLGDLLRSSSWLLGIVLVYASIPFTIQALAFGDVTVIVPIFSVSMAIAMLLGFLVLRERLAPVEWTAIFAMFAATALVATDRSTMEVSLAQRIDVLTIGVPSLIAVILVLSARQLSVVRITREHRYAAASGLLGGACDALVKLTTSLVREDAGGFQVVAASTLSHLVVEPAAYLVVAFFVGTFLMEQLAYANGRVSVVLPVRSAMAMSVVIVVGGVVFQESFGPRRVVGVAVLMIGTVFLAARHRSPTPMAAGPEAPAGG